MYKVVRMFSNFPNEQVHNRKRTIKSDLTLEEARAHCQREDTSSSTCPPALSRKRGKGSAQWFDGYEEQYF